MSSDLFEREKAAFEQNSEHLRSMNQLMWQVPLIAMTLTGGAWYGIAQLGPSHAASSLLILVGCANVGLAVVMLRVRFVFERLLKVTQNFYPPGSAATNDSPWPWHWEYVVVTVFVFLLLLAAATSFMAARDPTAWMPTPKTSHSA